MRIAMVSEHASPLSDPGGSDVSEQGAHVAGLAGALASRGHEVDVYTRRAEPHRPEWVWLCPGVVVHQVSAGPVRSLPTDRVLAHLPDFSRAVYRAWRARRPDLVHAHTWVSGVAAAEAAGSLGIPVAVTFHDLGTSGRNGPCRDSGPPARADAERCLARTADLVVATSWPEADRLTAMGAPVERLRVVTPADHEGSSGEPLWARMAELTEMGYRQAVVGASERLPHSRHADIRMAVRR